MGGASRVAVETGFRRAFPAIRDSNVSTMIACAILYLGGSNVVKGFALTLGLGVVVSFFSAVLITQSLLTLVLNRRLGRNPRLYTEIHEEYSAAPPRGSFDIVGSRNLYFFGLAGDHHPRHPGDPLLGLPAGPRLRRRQPHRRHAAAAGEHHRGAADRRQRLSAASSPWSRPRTATSTRSAPCRSSTLQVQKLTAALEREFGIARDARGREPDPVPVRRADHRRRAGDRRDHAGALLLDLHRHLPGLRLPAAADHLRLALQRVHVLQAAPRRLRARRDLGDPRPLLDLGRGGQRSSSPPSSPRWRSRSTTPSWSSTGFARTCASVRG